MLGMEKRKTLKEKEALFRELARKTGIHQQSVAWFCNRYACTVTFLGNDSKERENEALAVSAKTGHYEGFTATTRYRITDTKGSVDVAFSDMYL